MTAHSSNIFVRSYEHLIKFGMLLQDVLLLIARIYWGYAFHLAGCEKLTHVPETTNFFGNVLRIPFAEFNVYLVGGFECFGGILLILGLATRLICLPLAIIMVTALVTAHLASSMLVFSDPDKFLTQGPVTFLLILLLLFCFGPGKLSVDYLLQTYVFKKKYE